MNACAGVGFTGSATLVVRDGTTYGRFIGGEKEIFWPVGFVLVSDPPVWRVVAPDGRLFATEGEDITAFLLSEQWRGWSVCVGGTSIGVYCAGGDDCVRRAGAATPAANPANEWLSADGMARAAALRTSLGLRADDAWIRFVATDPRALANAERYSIPMLDTEVAHVDDRETLIAALARFGASHADAWGGYYFAGNIVVVMLVDPTGSVEQELHAATPQPVVVMPARWSSQELTDLANRIADDPWLEANYDLLSAGADVEHNAVALEVSSADPAAPADIAGHLNLGNQLIVTSDGTGEGNGGNPRG